MTAAPSVATEQVFALTDEEREAFGWSDTPMVLSTRMPSGRRCIPTREVTSRGETIYGSIETMEPPPGVEVEAWASRFGDDEEPQLGLTM